VGHRFPLWRSRRGTATAQQASVETIANRVGKYPGWTCDELWEKRGKRRSHEARRVIGFLRNEPALRTRFLDPIAGSAMNKIFECGMIP
jgi:hypothetical protein